MRVGGCVGGPFCGGVPSAGWLIELRFWKGEGRAGMGWMVYGGCVVGGHAGVWVSATRLSLGW